MKYMLSFLLALPVVGWSQTKADTLIYHSRGHEACFTASQGVWNVMVMSNQHFDSLEEMNSFLKNADGILESLNTHHLRAHRIVWRDAYLVEIPDSTEFLPDIIINTPLNVSNGGRNDWEGTDTAKIAAHLYTIRFPYSMDFPNAPYTGTLDSSGMWIWGRNKGIDYLDWPNRYPPMREAPITGYILPDTFRIFSPNLALAGDTTFLAAPSKKHTKKKP